MAENWYKHNRQYAMSQEYMPDSGKLTETIHDLTEVERVRVRQEEARAVFGSASFAGFSPYGNMPSMPESPSQSSWWSEKQHAPMSPMAGLFATPGGLNHTLPSVALQAGAQLAAGNPMGALGSMLSFGVGSVLRPYDQAANAMTERRTAEPFETDEFATQAGKYQARAAFAKQLVMESQPGAGGWEGMAEYDRVSHIARMRGREAEQLEMTKAGTAARLEHFFAPFAIGGVSPGQKAMQDMAELFQRQSEASFRIHADAQAVASMVNSSRPGVQNQQNKR